MYNNDCAFPILGGSDVGIKSESIIAFTVSLYILGSSLECAENFFMTSGGECYPCPSGSVREVGDDMMSCTCTGNLVSDELSPTTTTICSSMLENNCVKKKMHPLSVFGELNGHTY